MESATQYADRNWNRPSPRERLRALPLPRPELAALLILAALLDLWALGQNGWANEYYSAAVRSMAGSWHNFLFGSFDANGLMTVDKPPLALWVQALSVKAFGYSSLAILVPQALMGAASVGLLYDLTRRRWGRRAGFVAGLVLALTPTAVAVSRHNNPDALLVLCTVAALWAFTRALEKGATKWLVLAGVCVGLGFEAKMGAALFVVPGMALAWLWVAPRGRGVAVRQLLAAGAALVAVALAWPVMVELTPASSRPWIAGTSDNSVFSLILEYNGFGRLDGQAGGPGGIGNAMFGGSTGPLRLLNEALGGQAGWLLGLVLVGGIGIAVLSRLRRDDPRSGWIIAVGGSFALTAVAFSFASGIFHPYYVSLLAPFIAALAGATFAQASSAGRPGRLLGAAAIAGGAITELAVIGSSAGELSWLIPAIVLVAAGSAVALLGSFSDRARALALACGFGVLLIAPAIWSVDTLGHPTNGTFPMGGPESALMAGPGGGGVPGAGGAPGAAGGLGGVPGGAAGSGGMGGGSGFGSGEGGMPAPPGMGSGAESSSRPQLFGSGPGAGLPSTGAEAGAQGGLPGTGQGVPSRAGGGMAGGPGGGMFGGQSLTSALDYTESHGGGTLAVQSQSEAASSIIESGAGVAGIGGFSGKETSVSAAWLREAIESGRIRWILSEGSGGGLGRLPGDARQGSKTAIEEVTASCQAVPSSEYERESAEAAEGGGFGPGGSGGGTLYDCG